MSDKKPSAEELAAQEELMSLEDEWRILDDQITKLTTQRNQLRLKLQQADERWRIARSKRVFRDWV